MRLGGTVPAPDNGAGTVRSALAVATTRRDDDPNARFDCQLLLAYVLDVSRSWLYAHDDVALTSDQADQFNHLIDRWTDGVPVAQLIGTREFFGIELAVTDATLVPRPETELLVETALARLDPDRSLTVVDPGTGNGAIAIVLARARPNWRVVATDISAAALEVASHNCRSCGGAVSLVRGHWLAAFSDNAFDAIVSNPPYIREGDPHLPALRHEPQVALVSGRDGLDAIRTILTDACRVLKPGGLLMVEHGYDQQPDVVDAFEAAGFTQVDALSDLADNPRITLGVAP